MRITPLDIQQKNFPVKFRGFHDEEVSSFLELIREEIEDLLRENAALRERMQKADEDMRRFWEMENLLSTTLLEAHQMAEEYKMHGRKESALIIEKAEKKAEEIVGRAHEQARSIREGIRELRAMRKRFHHDMRDVLERVLRVIETDGEGGREVVGLYSVQDRAVPREIGGETEPAAETGEALLPEE